MTVLRGRNLEHFIPERFESTYAASGEVGDERDHYGYGARETYLSPPSKPRFPPPARSHPPADQSTKQASTAALGNPHLAERNFE